MPLTPSERGRPGGRATVARHGTAHMVAIGRRGYQATLARHWQGDRLGYARWLRARGWAQLLERLTDQALAAQLAAGATVACIEVPAEDLDDSPCPPRHPARGVLPPDAGPADAPGPAAGASGPGGKWARTAPRAGGGIRPTRGGSPCDVALREQRRGEYRHDRSRY